MKPMSKPTSKPVPRSASSQPSKRMLSAALTVFATALLGLSSPNALALSLGPIVVQSALGEPLRAEIDILEINAEEAASLRASVATPEAFRAAGLDYNAAMSNLRVTLLRRANGRSYIRLNSDRPVNDPFVDMILEATWSSGKIVRDYTMLFDPPNLREAPAAVAQAVQPTTAPATSPAPAAPATIAPMAPARTASAAPRAATPRAEVAQAKPVPSKAGEKAGEGQITVKAGDTATKIALATKPANVSLDQMLVALLQANPSAFINNNLNRIKSGAVLNVPTAEQANALGAKDASQAVIAQSRDFGDFRKKLAGAAPTAQVAAADRQSGGSVQTKVDDKKPGAAAPDKLTLSKGAVAAQTNADKLAKELAAKEATEKNAAVAKSNAELAKLGAAIAASAPAAPSAPSATSAPSTSSAAPGTSATAVPSIAVPTVSPAAAPAATGAAVGAAVVAAAPAASAPVPVKPVVKAPALPAPEPTLIDQLTENPLVPVGGVGLLALLAGFGLYRARERKKALEADSAFLESRLQPDSFFGGSGGQRVDTGDSHAGGGSSMVYTPSQLDAADDVDPVAEADVYLAYGRDVQAEEILKEALKTNSGRVAIHQKLLEIYAKRRDTRNFEIAATQAFKLTNGEGPEWTRICDQGISIDPANPLYSPGGEPGVGVGIPSQPASLDMLTAAASAKAQASAGLATVPMGAAATAAAAGLATVAMAGNKSFDATTASMSAQAAPARGVDLDFDLDLDFSLDEDNAKVISDLSGSESTLKMKAVNSGMVPLDMDFDMPTSPSTVSAGVAPSTRSSPLEFTLPSVTKLSAPGEISRPAPLEMEPSFSVDNGLDFEPSPVETEEFKHQAAVSFGTTVAGPLATFTPKAAEAPALDLMAFDMSALSLDLGDAKPAGTLPTSSAQSDPTTSPTPLEDPLATKLSLAEEFSSIGDTDGARALIEEVLLEARGDVRAEAQAALAKLS